MTYLPMILAAFLTTGAAKADPPKDADPHIKTEMVDYTYDGKTYEGFLAYDDSVTGKRPGVLVIHDWSGEGPYVEMRARMLAELGYVAFAADMYGKGMRPKSPQESSAFAGALRSDRPKMRAVARAALDVLRANKLVDTNKVAAIGYCFGGGASLELARSGAPLAGVVSFHGNLDTPNPADAKNIKGKVLVLHGGDDPFVKTDQVLAFEDEMRNAGVSWQVVIYGGAVHGFTNPASGDDNSKGAAYNALADKRSWQAMKDFFAEIFT